MRVARKARNTRRLNGKRRNANAYPARIDVTSWPATTRLVTIRLLRRYRLRWPVRQARENVLRSMSFGRSTPGKSSRRDDGCTDTTTAVYTGRNTSTAATVSRAYRTDLAIVDPALED